MGIHGYPWVLLVASLKVTACGDQGTGHSMNHTAAPQLWHGMGLGPNETRGAPRAETCRCFNSLLKP